MNENKMTYREFVENAIKKLRVSPYKGIHVVYSNFNGAFRLYFNEEPRPIIQQMVDEGFLVSRIVRGGAIIMLATDADDKVKHKSDSSTTLATILSRNS